MNPSTAVLTSREQAIVDFALKVSAMQEISSTDFDTLQDQGIDGEDAYDIGAIVAFFNMSNRYAHLLDMRPNAEFYSMARKPKEG